MKMLVVCPNCDETVLVNELFEQLGGCVECTEECAACKELTLEKDLVVSKYDDSEKVCEWCKDNT